jgi:hypothetical protein
MPEIVADRVFFTAFCCFPEPESRNVSHLALIAFCLARARQKGTSPGEAKAVAGIE